MDIPILTMAPLSTSPSIKNPIEHSFLQTKEEIQAWLELNHICDYTIHKNLTVSAPIVDLRKKSLKFIPVQFKKVDDFDVSDNMLTSLKGSPKYAATFSCNNNELTSLEFAPLKVENSFSCYNNSISSLEHCPLVEGSRFNCSHNKLKNLIGLKLKNQNFDGSFVCNYNLLTSLEGSPTTIKGDFQCNSNLLESLEHAPKTVGGDFYAQDNLLSSLKGCPTHIGMHCSIHDNPYISTLEFIPETIGRTFCFNNTGILSKTYKNNSGDTNCNALLEKIKLEHSLTQKSSSPYVVVKV